MLISNEEINILADDIRFRPCVWGGFLVRHDTTTTVSIP